MWIIIIIFGIGFAAVTGGLGAIPALILAVVALLATSGNEAREMRHNAMPENQPPQKVWESNEQYQWRQEEGERVHNRPIWGFGCIILPTAVVLFGYLIWYAVAIEGMGL